MWKVGDRRQIDRHVVWSDLSEYLMWHQYDIDNYCSHCKSVDCWTDCWEDEEPPNPLASLANAFDEPIYKEELEPWSLLR